MKVIQTETKKHAIKTFVAQNADDEARILVEILRKEPALKPRTEEEVLADAGRGFVRQDKEYIEINDELVAQLPDTLKQTVLKVKERFNANLQREQQKNENKQKLVELANGTEKATGKDVPFLQELAKLAQGAADDNVAFGGGWGHAREIFKVFPVTKV
jgi:hypothetical protein